MERAHRDRGRNPREVAREKEREKEREKWKLERKKGDGGRLPGYPEHVIPL